ncbi:MAG: DUF192 domain-containing protein [Haloarculaceae archaeon]
MGDRPVLAAVLAVLALAAVAAVVVQSGLIYSVVSPNPGGYERVTVTTYDENGTRLATVRVRVADTRQKRYVGLSNTSELATGEGMLFVHPSEGRHSYVMRRMDFPLDIVFIDASESVTTIHHAPAPKGEYERTYTGRGKWVLEVPRGWTNRTGLDPGDRVEIPERVHDTGR